MSAPGRVVSEGSDFSPVTELPGNQASAEQLSMIHTRYHLAFEHCAGKDVLEAACGPGRGLGYLAKTAKSVVGGDLTPALVAQANSHYAGLVSVVEMDAQRMPWDDARFDVVLLFEALYYLPRVDQFLKEAKRVLRPRGTLLLCTPNPEWSEFNPSPFSQRYFPAAELRRVLEDSGFDAKIKAGFSAARKDARGRVVAAVRRTAVSAGLIPKTMKGKAWLKRLFYGRLATLGPEIDTSVPISPLFDVPSGPVTDYKVLYAIAHSRE